METIELNWSFIKCNIAYNSAITIANEVYLSYDYFAISPWVW